MKKVFLVLMVLVLGGCATWQGVKKDTSDGAEWTKDKVNQGATYVKEKTN